MKVFFVCYNIKQNKKRENMKLNLKNLIFIVAGITVFSLSGCSNKQIDKNSPEYIKLANLCKTDGTPAPFWICKNDILNMYQDYYLISLKTYIFDNLKAEFEPKLRKKLKIKALYKLLSYNIVRKELGINKNNYQKILTLFIKNINKIAMIDKIFVPFSQSNLRINSYALIVFNKKEMFKIIDKIQNNTRISTTGIYESYYN